MIRPLLLSLLLAASLPASLWAASPAALVDYQPGPPLRGRLASVGSDTLANLVSRWAERFQHLYPEVAIEVLASGSATAPAALIQGTASLGAMSRPMKALELEAFEERYGYPPLAVPVAVDALAIFVNRDNPVPGLTLAQLDQLFSSTRLCARERVSGDQADSHWQVAGLGGEWADEPVELFGRNAVSGTYGYFKAVALCHGDFKARYNELPGSSAVVQAVGRTLGGIGYAGMGYRSASVRSVPLARVAGEPLVAPSARTALDGSYPLARRLYVYINQPPGQPLPALQAEFLRLVLSRQGQQAVSEEGYIPLPVDVVQQTLQRLGLDQARAPQEPAHAR